MIKNSYCLGLLLSMGGLIPYGCKPETTTNKEKSIEAVAATVPKTDTILIQNMAFMPGEINVKKGDTLVFINKDIFAHDVTEKDKIFRSPTLNPGDKYKKVADNSFEYYCSIHVVMKGKINVQ